MRVSVFETSCPDLMFILQGVAEPPSERPASAGRRTEDGGLWMKAESEQRGGDTPDHLRKDLFGATPFNPHPPSSVDAFGSAPFATYSQRP